MNAPETSDAQRDSAVRDAASPLPSDPSLRADQVRIQVAALSEHLQRVGVQWLPRPSAEAVARWSQSFLDSGDEEASQAVESQSAGGSKPRSASPPQPDRNVEAGRPAMTSSPGADSGQDYPGDALDEQLRRRQLGEWADRVAGCTRCEVLAKCRNKTVFGEGHPSPRVVFFGEGPGRDEDVSGRPFVGKAGQLLTKMIQACGFSRDEVYIMNTVKCRPPNNRNPEPSEVENCREYFEAQLQLLRPEYIVCLGLVSAQALLKNKLSVGRMRGKFHRHFASKVVVTYHPSYLLRTPAAKKAAWDDLQMMLRDAGLLT